MSRETDLAWAAGIMDGEGTIGISPINCKHSGRKVKVYRVYALRVAISNTDPRILARIKQILGGYFYPVKHYKSHYKPVYRWAAACKNAYTVLDLLLPYLVGKRDQAEIAIAFAKLRRQRGLANVPPDDARRVGNDKLFLQQEASWQKLKDMKRQDFSALQ